MTATTPQLPWTNLPVPLTPLVGRGLEIERAQAILLRAETRLLTFTGPGGIGKTRLAVEVARQTGESFRDGTCFVPLAAVADSNLVPAAIAQAIGLRESSAESLADRLVAYLRSREVLLILDNVEQLLPDVAPVIAALLTGCPALKIVVTSRVPVHLSGEREFPVPPLALPKGDRLPPVVDLLNVEAVLLFVDRAQAANPDFTLGDANASTVISICRRLDGLPLAIELAAARLKAFPLGDLLRRLDRRLPLLTGGPLDLPARQQTLRNAIAWSYDLLTADEQILLRRLSVFAGGFSLDAAEQVGRETEDGSRDQSVRSTVSVLDGVASLVDKSLLQQVPSPGGEARFAMLETVCEYAREQLVAAGEEESARRRHAAWFLDLSERIWAALLRGPIRVVWLDQAETEHDNLRAALAWFDDAGETEGLLRLTGALWPFWVMHSHLTEWTHWIERSLPRLDDVPPLVAGKFLQSAGRAAGAVGRPVGGIARYDFAPRALAIFRELGDSWGIATSLYGLGSDALDDGRYAEARERLQEMLVIFEERGELDWVALGTQELGEVAYELGDVESAQQLFARALALHREMADPWGTAWTLSFLGLLAAERGEFVGAAWHFSASLPLWREVGSTDGLIRWLARVAVLAVRLGHPEIGTRLLGTYQAIAERLGMSVRLAQRTAYEAVLAEVRGHLGESVVATAIATGRALPLGDAIGLAEEVLMLAETPTPLLATSTLPIGLTPREQEVLCLLAAGRTYPQIAEALFLSTATIRTHVQHIYTKLEVQSRHEAAAYARAHGLC